jgi:hypothetical protein
MRWGWDFPDRPHVSLPYHRADQRPLLRRAGGCLSISWIFDDAAKGPTHMTMSRSTRASALGAYTSTHLTSDAVREIGGALNALLADSLALYLKTRNFHWHVSGPNFRE